MCTVYSNHLHASRLKASADNVVLAGQHFYNGAPQQRPSLEIAETRQRPERACCVEKYTFYLFNYRKRYTIFSPLFFIIEILLTLSELLARAFLTSAIEFTFRSLIEIIRLPLLTPSEIHSSL